MVENLKRGDKVVTSGGIIGTVERIIENDIGNEYLFTQGIFSPTVKIIIK